MLLFLFLVVDIIFLFFGVAPFMIPVLLGLVTSIETRIFGVMKVMFQAGDLILNPCLKRIVSVNEGLPEFYLV
jgi:hypothetical protein